MFGAGGAGTGHYHSRTRSKPTPKKGKNTVIVYDVTLEDLYNGKTVTMNLERQGICGTCSGTGGKRGARSKTCVKCSGKGKIMVNRLLSGGLMAQSQALCPVCDGQGTKIRDVDQCRKCKGEKTTKEKKKTTWHIEKGMIDGQRVTLREHGDQYPGAPTGDVVFILKLQPHQTLKQSSEYDLLATVSVTLSEALTGFSRVVFHHLDGRGISVTVPPGRVINNGDSFKVEGEGMPIERSERKGDLWLKFELEKIDEDWAKNVDLEALAKLLPSKRQNVVPKPEIIDDVTLKLDDNPPQPREPRPQQSHYYEEEEDQQDYYDDSDDDGGTEFCNHSLSGQADGLSLAIGIPPVLPSTTPTG
ncbi:-domain-containing protein [Phaffia rhodozyma]|uniref:-domain-containing protein n=1 Tax=Phaffia rhodozyma TaxID=264483 RepID=A0A0F7SVY1_PHARH|nr:-domain-containing protein [Phaffia rhodozyma]